MRTTRLLVLLSLLGLIVAAGNAAVAADRTGVVTLATPFSWTGARASGSNASYDASSTSCGKNASDYCDDTLVRVDVPPEHWRDNAGGLLVTIRGTGSNDFDLYVYVSDAEGSQGALTASSTNGAGLAESVRIEEATGYYLMRVIYYAVDAATYEGRASLFTRLQAPPDVDVPAGIQEVLVSDPSKGFTSHSEPHLAQSPLDPDLLVGASKFYNRDRDALAEYEFKVGSYVSFTGGRAWTDLGQLGVCPPEAAPPSSWPNHDCYPDEDPARAGTGPEDARDGRFGDDFGEEYLTSDPWVEFDDEGNAYAMVLDAPPYPSGAGWGMSFHIWETVAQEDLRTGETWGPRIEINAYRGSEQSAFLDDKNTFAVNNAGPDADGKVGTIIACWTRSLVEQSRQEIVCERSTDGGRSWDGPPRVISPPGQRFVIGVDVVADVNDPDTFYAAWLDRTTSPQYLRFATTTDGGRSWRLSDLERPATALPATFPDGAFRNVTLPSMAVAPNGDIVVTYAEYVPAFGADEDGRHADIMMIRRHGRDWTEPLVVNQDRSAADQFQPVVAISEAGQMNIAFFDRRHDTPIVREGTIAHPGNFFIDNYLARSSDLTATFREERLSHALWDPTINPPISSWGNFIGDYQGLIADTCTAVAFFNDTHLATSSQPDPEFDEQFAASRFQEVFAWRVPNTAEAAGRSNDELNGGPGKDRFCAFHGADVLRGGAGSDVLRGGAGPDVLNGGHGRDRCLGGPGRDSFEGCEVRKQ